ncbi:lipopolysaccharide assembly protein LapB [Mechercharimyces sp. CAU 1602]|uniref:tetratricopeptide repeat protein n=1 Tax=Mechercharimyces sp. CAU 1602 TaxID=2973933 RepID=UPI002163BABB|nr:tetratricopeptide repeat protein [Mechercharimyces sp. CAU 1602]MCS1352205.1 tetratricopeptide repeat protein [Mechercharimyces sp. CAU 1602]
MKRQPLKWDENKTNVVRLRLDAAFFFERAVRSLDKHHYDKALKYFRLAVEKEPQNAVNHCNLAGILSEVGRYRESNEVLQTVLADVDSTLYECHFYMANNAANMDHFEEAEEHLLSYLEEDPDGEFAEEAEEMLDMLSFELGRQARQPQMTREDWVKRHEEARLDLEEGRFAKAIAVLKDIVCDYPEFLAARNNLALAYYYMGKLEDAIQTVEAVLAIDASNLHALCNLAVLYEQAREGEQQKQLIASLKKIVPLHKEHMYKLATTMGVLGEHDIAYREFRRLVRVESDPEPSLYHYAAVAAYHLGEIEKARQYWTHLLSVDNNSKVARFYLQMLSQWTKERKKRPHIEYHYQLPFMELIYKSFDTLPMAIAELPLFRAMAAWLLYNGEEDERLRIIRLYGWMGDEEAEHILRKFLISREENMLLKQTALLALTQGGAAAPYRVWNKGEEHIVDSLPMAKASYQWEKVLDCCLSRMKNDYTKRQIRDAQVLWFTLIQYHDPLPPIRKEEGWAAAIEYLVAKKHGIPATQIQLAQKYRISSSTISKKVQVIERDVPIDGGVFT